MSSNNPTLIKRSFQKPRNLVPNSYDTNTFKHLFKTIFPLIQRKELILTVLLSALEFVFLSKVRDFNSKCLI